jgi:HEAT repeat protein
MRINRRFLALAMVWIVVAPPALGQQKEADLPKQFGWDLTYESLLKKNNQGPNDWLPQWLKKTRRSFTLKQLASWQGEPIIMSILIESPAFHAGEHSIAWLFRTKDKAYFWAAVDLEDRPEKEPEKTEIDPKLFDEILTAMFSWQQAKPNEQRKKDMPGYMAFLNLYGRDGSRQMLLTLEDFYDWGEGRLSKTLGRIHRVERDRILARFQDATVSTILSSHAWPLIQQASATEKETLLVMIGAKENDAASMKAALERGGGIDYYRKTVADLLQNKDECIRAFAAVWLGLIGDKKSATDLLKLLRSKELPTRNKSLEGVDRGGAALGLGLLGAEEHSAEIAAQLKSPSHHVRSRAALGLGAMKATQFAADVANLIKPGEIKPVDDPAARDEGVLAAVTALAYMGAKEQAQHIAGILTSKESRTPGLKKSAIYALAKLKASEHAKTIGALLDDQLLKGDAAQALALMNAQEFKEKIVSLLGDENPSHRCAGLMALGILRARECEENVAKHLNDATSSVQSCAAWSLVLMESQKHGPKISPELDKSVLDVHAKVGIAAGEFRQVRERALASFEKVTSPRLRAQDEQSRALALNAMKAHGGKELLARYKGVRMKFKGTSFAVMGEGQEKFSGEKFLLFPTRMKSINTYEKLDEVIRVTTEKQFFLRFQGKVMEQKVENAQKVLYLERVVALVDLDDKDYRFAPLGEAKVDGKEAVGIRVSREGHADIKLYFDKGTQLLVKYENRVKYQYGDDPTSMKEHTHETILSDYANIMGIQTARKIVDLQDGKTVCETTITDVTYAETFPDSYFAKP